VNGLIRDKSLLHNFSYLTVLYAFNLLIPLFTYPYLIRVLGKETYGLVIYAQAIINYFAILVSFGFNISATKEISIHRENKEKLSEIVSSVLIIKGYLFIISLVSLAILLFFIPQSKGNEALFLLSMTACLNEVLFPIWYFQGIEKMKYWTQITVISRLIFLIFIFFLIHGPKDYLYVPIIYGIGYLISGSMSLYIIFYKHKIKFQLQSFRSLKFYFKNSVSLFISNISANLYSSTNKIIIGLFLGLGEVAYYDIAEKITTLLKLPQVIINQTVFPKISKEKNIKFIKRVFNSSIFLNILLIFIVILFSKNIITILGGASMLPAAVVVNILILTVFLSTLSNVFGIQILISFGYNRVFNNVILTSSLFYFFLLFTIWLISSFTIINITISTVATEMFMGSYMFYYTKKYKIWL
jgi:O-antigen/teichoic acid export membrane protein